MGSPVPDRALNRALLERQLLLCRHELPALDVVEHLVGMQSQLPASPYLGLWARLESFSPAELAGLFTSRRVVRMVLMRSTIHLVSDRDGLGLRPIVQPNLLRALQGSYGKQIAGLDLQAVARASRVLLEQEPRTSSQLGAVLTQQWPDRDPGALAQVARSLLPLVQVPPRGIWGASGPASSTTAESWLGRPLEPHPAIEELVRRYLAAFGPATVKDIQTWSGLTRLREVTDRMRADLVTLRGEHGQELLDLPDAPRPSHELPAPPRLLPDYDNVLLSHADRRRIIATVDRPRIMNRNGFRPTVLVDGFVAGTWTLVRAGATAVLTVASFRRLPAAARRLLDEEGRRLLGVATPDATERDVRFTVAD